MAPSVVVVDAYSSGNQVAPALRARGYQAVHVRTMADPSAALLATYVAGDFAEDLDGTAGPEAVAAALREARGLPAAVILGTETGAAYADALAAALGLPGNPPETSSRRRDKFEMVAAAGKAGLHVARQLAAEDAEAVLAWRAAEGLREVVVKPRASAGADDVRRCASDLEVREAVAATLGKTNAMGGANDAVVAQELLAGDEYYVNTVSCRGAHHVCEIWRYHKVRLHGRDFVYDHNDLVADGGSELARELGDYVGRALDALDLGYGPAHVEVMRTPEGPALIEVGPRLQGMASFGVNAAGIGYGPLELTLDAYLDPGAFPGPGSPPYRSRLQARRVFLRAFRAGVLRGYRHEERLRALPSCDFLRWIKSPGDRLWPTVDYFSIPGIMVLVHEDPAQLEADFLQVRELERDGLFELAEAAP